MTPTEALDLIRRAAVSGRIRFSRHARNERMPARNITHADVRHALSHAEECQSDGAPNKWKVRGDDLDGQRLRVIVVLEHDVLVVTVF